MAVPQWNAVLDLQRAGLAAESKRLHRTTEPRAVLALLVAVMGDARLDDAAEFGLQRLYRAACAELPSRRAA